MVHQEGSYFRDVAGARMRGIYERLVARDVRPLNVRSYLCSSRSEAIIFNINQMFHSKKDRYVAKVF